MKSLKILVWNSQIFCWESKICLFSCFANTCVPPETPKRGILFLGHPVYCELMLLDLGDLLWLSWLRNFFSAARSIFSCKYFSKIAQYCNSSNLIPHFVLLISWFPNNAQKTACTQLSISIVKWSYGCRLFKLGYSRTSPLHEMKSLCN